MGYDVLETHSRKSQSYRERVSESFRNRKGVIMFTSDVSARGLDYPDVTQVVQVWRGGSLWLLVTVAQCDSRP